MKQRPLLVRNILGIATLVLVGVWLAPRLLSLYYQVSGGMLLQQVLQTEVEAGPNAITCTLDPVTDLPARKYLEKAARQLTRSSDYSPDVSQTYLLQGKVNCLLDKPELAVTAYQRYTSLRPENPLGHLELGFAYEAACRNIKKEVENQVEWSIPLTCQGKDSLELILSEWEKGGLVTGQLFEAARRAFIQQKYSSAARWYQYGAMISTSIPFSTYFQWSMASVISNQQLPDFESPTSITLYPLTDLNQIQATELYWTVEDPTFGLEIGSQLKDFPGNYPNLGVMWWEVPW